MAFELEPVSKRGWTVVLIMMNIGTAHLDNALSPANNARANQASDTRYQGFKPVILPSLCQQEAAAVCLGNFLANRPEINSLNDYEKVVAAASKQKVLTGTQHAGLQETAPPPAVCLNTDTSQSKSEPFRPVKIVVPMPVATDPAAGRSRRD